MLLLFQTNEPTTCTVLGNSSSCVHLLAACGASVENSIIVVYRQVKSPDLPVYQRGWVTPIVGLLSALLVAVSRCPVHSPTRGLFICTASPSSFHNVALYPTHAVHFGHNPIRPSPARFFGTLYFTFHRSLMKS